MPENSVTRQDHFSFDRSCEGRLSNNLISKEVFEISYLGSGDATAELTTRL